MRRCGGHWSSGRVPASIVPGPNLGPGSPKYGLTGGRSHCNTVHINNVLKPQASVGCKSIKKIKQKQDRQGSLTNTVDTFRLPKETFSEATTNKFLLPQSQVKANFFKIKKLLEFPTYPITKRYLAIFLQSSVCVI